jgi:hypothetical protein
MHALSLNSFHIYPITYSTTGFKNLLCQQFTYPIPNSQKKNYHLGDHKQNKHAPAVPLSHPSLFLAITKKQPTIPSRGDHPPITNSWAPAIFPLHQPLLRALLLLSRHLSAALHPLITTTHQILPSPTPNWDQFGRCKTSPPPKSGWPPRQHHLPFAQRRLWLT